MDLYRIESSDEIDHLELSLYVEDKEFLFAEWVKKFLSSLERQIDPEWNIYLIKIEVNDKSDDGNKVK